MKEELQVMLKSNFVNLLTRENVMGFIGRRIDRNFLIENIADFGQHFYICGSTEFVANITEYLLDLGVTPDSLVIEK